MGGGRSEGRNGGKGEGNVGGRTGRMDLGREGCTDGWNVGRWREGVINVKSKKG